MCVFKFYLPINIMTQEYIMYSKLYAIIVEKHGSKRNAGQYNFESIQSNIRKLRNSDPIEKHIERAGGKVIKKLEEIEAYVIEADSNAIHILKGKGYKPRKRFNKI